VIRLYFKTARYFYSRTFQKGNKEPVGIPFRRDPESPCTGYEPRKKRLGDWDYCETDGHYLCQECCHKADVKEYPDNPCLEAEKEASNDVLS